MLPLGRTLASTVIKVPHHGSRTSLSEPFLRSIHPQYAVISVGRNNRYRHPHPETIQALSTTAIYRTDRDGAIGMHLKPDGSLLVKTWQQPVCSRSRPAG
jgi:competence protein ComEC